MTVKDTPICSYCDAIDDIPHFLWGVKMFKICELDFSIGGNQVGYHNVNFPTPQSENEILFGFPNNGENNVTLNICMLHIKHYSYKQRLFHDNEMQFGAIKNMLSAKPEIEKNILSRENKPQNTSVCSSKCLSSMTWWGRQFDVYQTIDWTTTTTNKSGIYTQ